MAEHVTQVRRTAVEALTELYYDRDNDILYLSIGKPRSAISRELGDNVLIRMDPATGEVIGLTVMNLSARYGDMDDPHSLPINMLLKHVA